MHLQCHNCGWSQDDFWSKEYNPIRGLVSYESILLDVHHLDDILPAEGHRPEMTRRQQVLRAMRLATKRVEEMLYPCRSDIAGATCPKCQSRLVLSRQRDDEMPTV